MKIRADTQGTLTAVLTRSEYDNMHSGETMKTRYDGQEVEVTAEVKFRRTG